MTNHVFFAVFPKSGTGLLHSVRGVKHHVPMFDKRGDWRTPEEYAESVMQFDECTGHVPYSHELHALLKQNGYRIVFVFRSLRDVVVSLVNYVQRWEGSELNVSVGGIHLSRCEDPILSAIDVVADWWQRFELWMRWADAAYTFRELRGAALLTGREADSFTFNMGKINYWQHDFKPHHIEVARAKLPDVLRQYNLMGCYDCERMKP